MNADRLSEVAQKLGFIREALKETGANAVRLRGSDWFSWATTGGSSVVLLTADSGVAEVLVTAEDAWILTDEIEATRLQAEEIPSNFKFQINPWAEHSKRQAFVHSVSNGGKILSDRPTCIPDNQEQPLPPSLIQHKRVMCDSEVERYRQVGRKASEAMTEVLSACQPTWTEYQLAGAGAEALWARGLHPALTLVAGERRLPIYRHATATEEKIGRVAMMVFCARGYGLYANLTRFVYFGAMTPEESKLHHHVQQVEAVALDLSQAGKSLSDIYHALAASYGQQGYPKAILEHHQGGTTGYLAREVVATPETDDVLQANMAIAWNPSLSGAKIEDTFITLPDGKLENLTFDPNWRSVEVAGRLRPVPLEVK